MPRITAVSIDTEGTRVVTGRRTGARFTVERTLSLAGEELDAFLMQDQADDYLLAINPEDAQYETITIPPVAPKLEASLIRAETARLHPELLPFSCGWQIIGDVPQEGRTVRKVACCLTPHRCITPLLEPFIRHNKRISCIIAAPVILSALVRAVEPLAEPLLCAHDSGKSKLLFLLEGGAVTFARTIASNEYGWDAFDRQNTAMTMDYCFQALRVRPERVLVLNPAHPLDPLAAPPLLEPLALDAALHAELPPSIMQEFLIPFLLAAWPHPPHADLMPEQYQAALRQQKLLRTATTWFGGGTALLLLLSALQLVSLNRLQTDISALINREGGLTTIHQAHRQALKQRDQVQPMITALSDLLAAADIPSTLVALNNLHIPETRFTGLVVKRDKGVVGLQLSGTVSATGFAASQERFEAVLKALQQIKGMTLGTHRLDPKNQTFTIEATRTP